MAAVYSGTYYHYEPQFIRVQQEIPGSSLVLSHNSVMARVTSHRRVVDQLLGDFSEEWFEMIGQQRTERGVLKTCASNSAGLEYWEIKLDFIDISSLQATVPEIEVGGFCVENSKWISVHQYFWWYSVFLNIPKKARNSFLLIMLRYSRLFFRKSHNFKNHQLKMGAL
jgi:hypothetical protein